MSIMQMSGRGLLLAGAVILGAALVRGAHPTFLPDDPLRVFPEPGDASGVRPRPVSQGFDFVENSFLKPGERQARPAGDVNTIDEVPDSSWFTNRIGSRQLSADELRRGANKSDGPAPGRWRVVVGDATGVTPGFRIRDSVGDLYFIKVDPPGNPGLATGAEVVSSRIMYALGYNVPENSVSWFTREMLDLSEAEISVPEGGRRKMTDTDLDALLAKAARQPDGRYRVIASRALEGTAIGPFRYFGTIPDDPNDIVPHEHRRELRGLRVFAAWLNHMDSRGINSLDTLVTVDGRARVRHNLIDFGSTLGSAAVAVKSRRSGYAYLWDMGEGLRTLATFGAYVPGWARIDYPRQPPAIGRFEAEHFDPAGWVPHYPNPAFDNARPDDTFWAARRVAAFTDEAVRTIVETAQYSDPDAAAELADVLIRRRDRIAQAWLTPLNPVVDVSLDAGGVLRFDNAAVRAGVSTPPREYVLRWSSFDNATGTASPLATETTTTTTARAPRPVLDGSAEFVRLDISAIHVDHPAWERPVQITFRREREGWKTVGLARSIP